MHITLLFLYQNEFVFDKFSKYVSVFSSWKGRPFKNGIILDRWFLEIDGQMKKQML
jgi:hypothetical protein